LGRTYNAGVGGSNPSPPTESPVQRHYFFALFASRKWRAADVQQNLVVCTNLLGARSWLLANSLLDLGTERATDLLVQVDLSGSRNLKRGVTA
jgi:hypothetical protein